jgi:hypothetical protein
MAIACTRTVTHIYSGSQAANLSFPAAANANSPFEQDVRTFTGAGDNLVTVPTGGTTPVAVTIIPPAGNTATITLKGNTGDVGVGLHLTDPTSLGIAAALTNFTLTVSGTITGIRFVWA